MKTVSPVLDQEPIPMEYKAIYCNNTQVINSSRVRKYIEVYNLSESVLNQSWKECINPSYGELCGKIDEISFIYAHRGEKPFVICGYEKG